MAEMAEPELYLSLLSSRNGDVSRLSSECRDNDDGSRICDDESFQKDSDRLLDVLDALASICVHKEQGDVFFVSLAMDSNSATLYVSTNGTVPATLISHLHKIRGQLKELKSILEPASSPPPDIESTDPNNTPSRSAGELKIQRIIYEYSYKKVQRRYQKRGPEILAQYDAIMKSLGTNSTVVNVNVKLLTSTRDLLEDLGVFLQDDKLSELRFTSLIETIAGLSVCWKKHLEVVEGSEEEGLLSRWDNLASVKKNRHLSLRRFLRKLFTLHNHIRTILGIAWSRRLSAFLDGEFNVVSVPAACSGTSTKFSQPKVLSMVFPEDRVDEDVRQGVYDELLRRLEAKVEEEGLEMIKTKAKKGSIPELSISNICIHAESSLLAYHIQHPGIHPYRYFGGSKLSCHGCGVLFRSYNSVATEFCIPRFFTKGCHDKISLRWLFPSLQSQEQQKCLRPNTPSLDVEVKKAMIKALGMELTAYVLELREAMEIKSTPPQSDSTSASAGSRDPPVEDSDVERLELIHQEIAMILSEKRQIGDWS